MKKNERIEFRVTPDELQALKNIAGPRNVAGYIRSRIPELATIPLKEDRPRAEQATSRHVEGDHGLASNPPAPLDAEKHAKAEAASIVEEMAAGLPPPVAPKPVEKPRDPQPESDYRRIRRAGLKQRKL